MKVTDALRDITRLFLDTAPFIYLVERNPQYFAVVFSIFEASTTVMLPGLPLL